MTTTPRRGRPPKKPEDRRSVRIMVRITEDEAKAMDARRGEQSRAAYARTRITGKTKP